jgi:hypothetical protein
MFYHLRRPSSSINSSHTSFSSDDSCFPAVPTPPPVVLRELIVRDLDEISSTGFNQQRPMQREPFRIPRPMLTLPRPAIHLPTNNSLWTPSTRPTRVVQTSTSLNPSLATHHTRIVQTSTSPNPSLATHHSDRRIYQNLPPLLPPPIPIVPTLYQIGPPPFQRFAPIPVTRSIKPKKIYREKPPGLFTTLSAGGFSTVAVLIYLSFLLALPTTKLVLGILYVNACPVNKNIPLYMIVSGACGLAIIILLLLSSACTFCRFVSNTKKPTHRYMICIIALARGMQGALAIFLFIWFLFGNIWVFNARNRVRTDQPNDKNNYCNPTLYWSAFYILIFTYIYALFTCCIKFCVNFFCCGACDIWRKAFS